MLLCSRQNELCVQRLKISEAGYQIITVSQFYLTTQGIKNMEYFQITL